MNCCSSIHLIVFWFHCLQYLLYFIIFSLYLVIYQTESQLIKFFLLFWLTLFIWFAFIRIVYSKAYSQNNERWYYLGWLYASAFCVSKMSSPLNLVPERKWQQIIAFHNGRNKHNGVFDQNYITFHDLRRSQSKAVKQRCISVIILSTIYLQNYWRI